ncbi:MAG: hypothetical protein M5R36_08780 [Deltaproteobacteria bacterium]|nr:hypothetical protein [Deltaproteobacteria bacterium]
MAAYNLHAFGSVVTTGHLFQNPMFDDPNAAMGVLVAPSLTVLLAITVLPVRGLFWLSPVMVLSFHGLWITWRDPKRRAAALPATIVIAAYFAFNISYVTWHGGWCLGPRF